MEKHVGLNPAWFEPGPDGVSPFERISATVGFGSAGTAAAFRALLAAEVPALQVGDVDKDAEIARLKFLLDTQASDYKATCATAQLIESDRDHIRALYTKLQDSHDALTVERLTAERDEALDKLDAMTAERDALRARIEAGRIMYGGMYGHENKFEMWTFEHVDTDTMTARLIDIAPIAADERTGERRKGGWEYCGCKKDLSTFCAGSTDFCWRPTNESPKHSARNNRRDVTNSNDRRRTVGTPELDAVLEESR